MCDNIIDLRMACDLNGLDIDLYIAKKNQGDPIPVYAHVGAYLLGVIETHQTILPHALEEYGNRYGSFNARVIKSRLMGWLRKAITTMILQAKLDCKERFYTRKQHEEAIDKEIDLGFKDMLRGLK